MVLRESSRWNRRIMTFQALLEADLVSMARSWAVRIWLILMTLQAMFMILVSTGEDSSAADALAALLGAFPVIWSTFIIINTSGAVSSEAGVVADSILSKAVTRYDYILAKMAGRLVTVVGLYLVITLPAAYLVSRYGQGSLDTGGTAWAITLIGMTLALLTTLSVAFSTLFNRTLVALIVVWFLWYSAAGIAALFQVNDVSPLHIVDSLPDLLVGSYAVVNQWHSLLGFTLLSAGVIVVAVVYFAHKDL
jgi:ABC-2 type transport system permease protein